MKITETCITDYFGRSTLSAEDEKVILHFKNMKYEFTREFLYSDLSAKSERVRLGVINAASFAVFLFVLNAILFVVMPWKIPGLKLFSLSLFMIPAYVFCLQFKKHEEVFFYTSKGATAFSFDVGKHPDFFAFINKKISNQSTHSITDSVGSE